MTPEAAVKRLLGSSARARIRTLLAQTPVSRTWQVSVDDQLAVLRIDGPGAARLGLNRQAEPGVLRVVAARSLGPACLAADPARGLLLTQWLPGVACTPADLRLPALLAEAAALLQRVHATPTAAPLVDLYAAVGRYARAAGPAAEPLAAATRAQLAICLEADPEPLCLCHGDPTPPNLIRPGLRLIDWEYAGLNHPGFDRAGFSVGAGLTAVEGDSWLAAALSHPPDPDERRRHAAWEGFCRLLAELWAAGLEA